MNELIEIKYAIWLALSGLTMFLSPGNIAGILFFAFILFKYYEAKKEQAITNK